MSRPIRTRFAPSPTGDFHIGGARTALFAYLWAKKHGGQFLLRIEDTDQVRSQAGSLESIFSGLRWLGLQWDEGPEVGGPQTPYFQSERLGLYGQYITELLENKHAYRCFCTTDRLAEMRRLQQESKLPPRYDRTCRTLEPAEIEAKLAEKIPFVVRLAVPEQGAIVVNDIVRGKVEFAAKDIDDQVLLKSDGFPTYHLANVVDDHLMGISHVIRGEEWLPSAPKHVLLYQAFGWDLPEFVHLSLFLSKQGGKMSKRHGETSLLAFRNQGYLPEAVVNFIALLGWNPKTEEEFFTMEGLIERFELTMINRANPIFETEKLQWMNHHYLQQLSLAEMLKRMGDLAETAGEASNRFRDFVAWFSALDKDRQQSIWESVQERAKTLLEVCTVMDWLNDPASFEPEELIWKKSDRNATIQALAALESKLAELGEGDYLHGSLEQELLAWIKANGWGNGDLLWPLRYALCGQKQSPSPFELAELLGKEETVRRVNLAYKRLAQE